MENTAISATIITFNEEDRIAGAIASLSCCNEILVVDSGSTDRTREIAVAHGARVLTRAWDGYSKQKNFAASQARNDWILSLDADERLSIELADSIVQTLHPLASPGGSRPSEARRSDNGTRRTSVPMHLVRAAAYSMPRRAFYLGRWIRHSGWYPDRKIRLYDRKRCRWEGDFVHERLKVDGQVDGLNGDLLHFPYRDWNDHRTRIERYTSLAAEAAHSAGRHGSTMKLVAAPPLAFIRSFLIHAGFLDGWRGLVIAYMGARYVFMREFRILR